MFRSGRVELEIGPESGLAESARARSEWARIGRELAGAPDREALAERARAEAARLGEQGPEGEARADLERIAKWALRDREAGAEGREGAGRGRMERARERARDWGWRALGPGLERAARDLMEDFGFRAVEIAGMGPWEARSALRRARAAARVALGRLGIRPEALGGLGGARLRLESERILERCGARGFFETREDRGARGRIRMGAGRKAGWTLAHEWVHLMDWELGGRAREAAGLGRAEGPEGLYSALPLGIRQALPEALEGFGLAWGALSGRAGESAEMELELAALGRADRIGREALRECGAEGGGERWQREALARWARQEALARRPLGGKAGSGEAEAKAELERARSSAREALEAAGRGGQGDLAERAPRAVEMAGLCWGPTGMAMGEGEFCRESLRGCWAGRTGYWAHPAELLARAVAGEERSAPWRHALLAGLGGEFSARLRGRRAAAPLLGREGAERLARGLSRMSEAAGLGPANLRASRSEALAAAALRAFAGLRGRWAARRMGRAGAR